MPTPRRRVRTQLARLGADTVAELRARFPAIPVDAAVRRLLGLYSRAELECRGCMGPCGHCEDEPAPRDAVYSMPAQSGPDGA